MAESEDRDLVKGQARDSIPLNSQSAGTDSAPAGPVEADSVIGAIIDHRYQIERLIGKGGMASVYRAMHVVIKKPVAVKILDCSTALKQETITRFHQEAKGSATLQHQNIVAISDFGMTETGQPYCVMDLVEGKPLSEVIQEAGAPQFARLKRLFGEVCDALAYAHSKNIIHRDIKPSNIIVCVDDAGNWVPKLIDFGIAKFGELQDITRAGALVGSPFYMSPSKGQDVS